ncbi:MAG: NAD-dependent epimerase/dehydratase family protein [Anaerolineales bacterium]
MKHALVVGISGFVGRHLAGYLLGQEWRVVGFDQQPLAGFGVRLGDLLDQAKVERLLHETRPDFIFHLAGVLKSDSPEHFYTVHVLGTLALLEAVMEAGLRPVIVVAGSSAVYGAGTAQRPITEKHNPQPLTHYAVSKLAQEALALRYWRAFGLPVICVRMFNLLGPGLSPAMACSDFARQIAQAEQAGKPATISTGNLDSRRDFVDVRDAARAYALLAEKGQPGQIYNVASGRAVSIRKCLDFLCAQARVPVEAALDPARVQPNDVPVQVGSADRLRRRTGWKAEVPLEQSLADLLDDWRQKINREQA